MHAVIAEGFREELKTEAGVAMAIADQHEGFEVSPLSRTLCCGKVQNNAGD